MAKVRVRLSFWTDGKNPGDVLEIEESELVRYQRDGRVAEVLSDEKDEDEKDEPKKGMSPHLSKKATPENK